MIRAGSAVSDSSQPPPGEIATTLRARPRLAISSDSAPPIELPAKCASATPSASSICSKWSAAWLSERAGPSGGGGPPSWPCSVGAITSKRGTSSARTGSQQRQVAVKPWTRTSGSPSPARYRAGEISEAMRQKSSQVYAGVLEGLLAPVARERVVVVVRDLAVAGRLVRRAG